MSDKDEEVAALKRRLEMLEGKAQPVAPAAPKKNNTAAFGCAFVALLLLLAMASMCSNLGSDRPAASYQASSWTPPEGYIVERAARGSVATKWFTPSRRECDRGSRCFGLSVVAEKGCSRSLYAEITILDSQGRNVGWTNDTAQGVQAGEEVKLIFHTYEDAARSARVADINCY